MPGSANGRLVSVELETNSVCAVVVNHPCNAADGDAEYMNRV